MAGLRRHGRVVHPEAVMQATISPRTVLEETRARLAANGATASEQAATDEEVSAALAELESDLEAEEAARVAGDASLSAAIAAEEAARVAGDSSLSAAIAALSGVYQPLDADLTAIAALGTAGMLARTAADTWALRTLTGDAEIVVADGDGVAGNPTLSIDASIARLADLGTAAFRNVGDGDGEVPEWAVGGLTVGPPYWTWAAFEAGKLRVVDVRTLEMRFGRLGLGVYPHTTAPLAIVDASASFALGIAAGSTLTAERVLTLTTGDADRTLTLTGNPTLADWFDQSVKMAATPQFARLGLGVAADASNLLRLGSATGLNYTEAGNLLLGTSSETGLTGAGGLRVGSTTEATASAGAAIVDGGLLVKKKGFFLDVLTVSHATKPQVSLTRGASTASIYHDGSLVFLASSIPIYFFSAGTSFISSDGYTTYQRTAAGSSSLAVRPNGTGQLSQVILEGSTAFPRWNLRKNSTSESGSDAGSDFEVVRGLDSGSEQVALTIVRATGAATFEATVRATRLGLGVAADGTRLLTHADTVMMRTTAGFADGAAAAAGTLLNAPAAGDPTKWIPIDDNGTTRYIPSW